MAVLKVMKCRECFYPLPDGVLECPKCHTVHKIVNEAPVNPLLLPPDVTNDYVNFFKQKTEENPKDTNALFGMGLVYMGLKNYELAQRNFKMAADQQPKEPDVYYYFALSLFEGHNPIELSDTVTKRIEEWLHTATNLNKKRKYLILQMVLRQGAFIARGLQIKGEQPSELMATIRTLMPEPDDLVEIEQHVQISDPQTKAWIDELKHGRPAPDKTRAGKGTRLSPTPADQYGICYDTTDRDADYSDPSDPAGSVERLLDTEARQEFFDYQYPFKEPVKRDLPFYPVMQTVWRVVKMVILTVIMLIVIAATEFGVGDYKGKTGKELYAEWEKKYIDNHNGKKPDAKTKKQKQEDFNADAQKEQEEYPDFFNDYYVFGYSNADTGKPVFGHITEAPEGVNIKEYSGIEKSWKGALAIFLVLLPLLYYLIRIIVSFVITTRDRRMLRAANKADRDNYENAMNIHFTRATKRDYIDFCRHYLAKASPWLSETGDPVTEALREHRVDELDMAGKVLFVNYFEDEDDNNDQTTHPDEVLRYIYYIIAVPQRDKLLIMNNKWDTIDNEFEHCSVETVYYDKILSMNFDGEEIDIKLVGGTETTIVLPPVTKTSLLAYQSKDPSDMLTFSNTRTSDPQDFVKALETLRAAYK